MNAARIGGLLLAAVLLAPAAFAAGPDVEGIWVGTAALPEKAVDDIVLMIGAEGTDAGGTVSDGLGIIRPETPIEEFSTGRNALAFQIPTVDGLILTFTLKARGDRLTGSWTDANGNAGKIELVRRYQAPPADAPSEKNPLSGNPR